MLSLMCFEKRKIKEQDKLREVTRLGILFKLRICFFLKCNKELHLHAKNYFYINFILSLNIFIFYILQNCVILYQIFTILDEYMDGVNKECKK